MARDLDAMRAWLIERISKALKVKRRNGPGRAVVGNMTQSMHCHEFWRWRSKRKSGSNCRRPCCGNITLLTNAPPIS